MKLEIRLSIICFLLCCCFIALFVYISRYGEHTYYVCQVGIYDDEANKDKKLHELKESGYEAVFYMNNNQYYVLSMITDNKSEIEKHSVELSGVVKEYKSTKEKSVEDLLLSLEKGELYD